MELHETLPIVTAAADRADGIFRATGKQIELIAALCATAFDSIEQVQAFYPETKILTIPQATADIDYLFRQDIRRDK
jgi:hypothetical protein